MVLNLGDVPAGSTLYVPFATYNSSGASVTISGLAVTDIEIYKNGSTTQRASDAGYALLDTDGIDFDGVTGIHGFSVDLSDNTDAGFYAAGSVYWLVVSAITVDSQTVNFVYYFTIDKASCLRPTTAGRTLDVTATGAAGIDWGNVENPTTAVNLSGTNIDTDQVVASVTGAVGSVTATVNANVTQISGDSTAADNLETLLDDTAGAVPWAGIIDQGTAQSATGTTLVLRAGAAFADDSIIGATIVITGSSGATTAVGQSRSITDYVTGTDTATVEAWAVTPAGTITYKIFATAPSSGGGGLDAAGVRAAVGLASANLDTQLSGLDTKLDTIESQTDDIGVAGAGLTALASQTSVNTIDDLLDTEVAAIKTVVDAVKAKTDSLTFTVANQLDANIQSINDVTITGDGQSGTEFGV